MFNVSDTAMLILALARRLLKKGEAEQAVNPLLSDLVTLLDLYRPPQYDQFNPGALLRKRLGSPDDQHSFTFEPVTDAVADADQIMEIISLLTRNARLGEATVLVANLFQQPDAVEKDGVPTLALSFDGGGSFPDPVPLAGGVAVPLEELRTRWTLATRGGRIDDAPNGLLLRLKGARLPVQPTDQFEPLRLAVTAAQSKPDLESVECALTAITGEPKFDSADLRALVDDTFRQYREAFQARRIECQLLFASELPPVSVWREAMVRLFSHLFSCTLEAGEDSTLDVLFEYDAKHHAVVFVATLTADELPESQEACLEALNYLVERHQGNMELNQEKRGISLTITLPDNVGRTVEEWIPGYERFSDQSRKILRLLKSGGPVPPEDFLLQGVLEEELARWLVPLLDKPPAINAANAIASEAKPAHAASLERLKKALDQIKKGKPKRELAKPAFAAEIIAAFGTEERRRAAIDAQNMDAADLESLVRGLVLPSPPYVELLRILARRN